MMSPDGCSHDTPPQLASNGVGDRSPITPGRPTPKTPHTPQNVDRAHESEAWNGRGSGMVSWGLLWQLVASRVHRSMYLNQALSSEQSLSAATRLGHHLPQAQMMAYSPSDQGEPLLQALAKAKVKDVIQSAQAYASAAEKKVARYEAQLSALQAQVKSLENDAMNKAPRKMAEALREKERQLKAESMACAELESMLADMMKNNQITGHGDTVTTLPEKSWVAELGSNEPPKLSAKPAASVKARSQRSPSEIDLRQRLYTMAWRLGYQRDKYQRRIDSLLREKEAQARERIHLRELLMRAMAGGSLADSEGTYPSSIHANGQISTSPGELSSVSRLIL